MDLNNEIKVVRLFVGFRRSNLNRERERIILIRNGEKWILLIDEHSTFSCAFNPSRTMDGFFIFETGSSSLLFSGARASPHNNNNNNYDLLTVFGWKSECGQILASGTLGE